MKKEKKYELLVEDIYNYYFPAETSLVICVVKVQ